MLKAWRTACQQEYVDSLFERKSFKFKLIETNIDELIAQTGIEIRFHVESSEWIPKWIREKLAENVKQTNFIFIKFENIKSQFKNRIANKSNKQRRLSNREIRENKKSITQSS